MSSQEILVIEVLLIERLRQPIRVLQHGDVRGVPHEQTFLESGCNDAGSKHLAEKRRFLWTSGHLESVWPQLGFDVIAQARVDHVGHCSFRLETVRVCIQDLWILTLQPICVPFYSLRSLSNKIAHSMIVTPFLKASSFTSLSLVSSFILAMARRCSSVLIPKRNRAGIRWRSEGRHDESIILKEAVDISLKLLILDPELVGWKDGGGRRPFVGVDVRGGVREELLGGACSGMVASIRGASIVSCDPRAALDERCFPRVEMLAFVGDLTLSSGEKGGLERASGR